MRKSRRLNREIKMGRLLKLLWSGFLVFLMVGTALFFGYFYYLCYSYKEGWLSVDKELPQECYTEEKTEEFEGRERKFYRVRAQYCPRESDRLRLKCKTGELIFYGVHGVWKPEGGEVIYLF